MTHLKLADLGECIFAMHSLRHDNYREVLVLYLKRPGAMNWELRRCEGRFRYSDLKEGAPGDYGICMWMSRF